MSIAACRCACCIRNQEYNSKFGNMFIPNSTEDSAKLREKDMRIRYLERQLKAKNDILKKMNKE